MKTSHTRSRIWCIYTMGSKKIKDDQYKGTMMEQYEDGKLVWLQPEIQPSYVRTPCNSQEFEECSLERAAEQIRKQTGQQCVALNMVCFCPRCTIRC
jgi:hypothetical protein